MRLGIVLVAAAASIMLAAQDAPTTIEYYPVGFGTKSCGEYLRAADAERKALPASPEPKTLYNADFVMFAAYADGWLSGANFMSGAYHLPQGSFVGQKSDTDGRMAFLESYCKDHPLNEFADAVSELMMVLVNKNAKSR